MTKYFLKIPCPKCFCAMVNKVKGKYYCLICNEIIKPKNVFEKEKK